MADLALTLIMAVWGSSFAILRWMFSSGQVTPQLLLALRMAIACLLLALFLRLTGRGRAQLALVSRALIRDGCICGAFLGVGFILQTEGLRHTTASRSGFLTGTLVVLVPILEYLFFRKRPRAWAIAGVALAFVGMTVLSSPWSEGARSTLPGDALTTLCALIFAGHIIVLGRFAPRHPVLPLLLLQLAVTGILAALAGPLIGPQTFAGSPRVWVAVVHLSLFATLLAFGIQTWAQKVMPPVRVALISSLEPVFAALWAAVLIGEKLSGRELLGGALIVLGVAVGEVGAALVNRFG